MNVTPDPKSGRVPEDRVSAYREARRAAARAHHPDLGGNADSLIEALHAVDRRFGAVGDAVSSDGAPTVGGLTTRRAQLARRIRAVRRALPSRRKYFDVS